MRDNGSVSTLWVRVMSARDSRLPSAPAPRFRPVAPGRLPAFVCEHGDSAIFYAPRSVSVLPRSHAGAVGDEIGRLAAAPARGDDGCASSLASVSCAAAAIVAAAHAAAAEASRLAREAFEPECLTLFLNNACNLSCLYCHAAPGAAPDRPVTDGAIRSAARLVAASCARRRRPFTVAFHGGGEPSLDEARVDRILDVVRAESDSCGVPLRTYIATNGIMPAARARWLAGRFDLVGLSCDGPPDVQDRQRPARDGRPTWVRANRTAGILRQAGRPFHVRATVTKATLDRQPEIVAHILERFAPGEIRIEPVYVNPAMAIELTAADAARFVDGYMGARGLAAAGRVPVTTSLARPAALYGRHCNVLRHVLNLAPGDLVTGCFLESREAGIDARGVRMGALNPASAGVDMDRERLASLALRCSAEPACCRDCLCALQCTHGCPDVCALRPPAAPGLEESITGSFRCHAHRLLMESLILDAADAAWRRTPPGVRASTVDARTSLRVDVHKGGCAGESRP